MPLLLLLPLLAARAEVRAVEPPRWGFDGRVVPGAFNPLSVLLANAGPGAFEGEVRLHKNDPGGAPVGDVLVQPLYLGPGGTDAPAKWIQFHPYVPPDARDFGEGLAREDWTLEWGGRPDERIEVPRPRAAAPALVFLADPGDPRSRPAALPSFSDDLFPPTVSACDGLAACVLDHAPRWDGAIRRAFADWVRRGGTVHLLRGPDGRHPEFPADLAFLNAPGERTRAGAGTVFRHPAGRREANPRDLAARGGPSALPAPEEPAAPGLGGNPDQALLRSLGDLVRPEFDWVLIELLILGYLAAVVPANWILGHRWKDPRKVQAFFLGSVGVFGLAFHQVGKRGYDETSMIHSLSLARSIGGADYDVSQWVDAFVTRDRFYEIAHAGDHGLYSTAQDVERVTGEIRAGREAGFRVRIPLFTSRPFLHRARMTGEDLGLRVVESEGDGRLGRLLLAGGPPPPDGILWGRVLHEGILYPLAAREGRLSIDPANTTALSSDPSVNPEEGWEAPFGAYGRRPRRDAEGVAVEAAPRLLRHALGGPNGIRRLSAAPRAPGRIRVFLLARSPAGFALRSKGMGQEIGFTLYDIELPLPGGEPPEAPHGR